MKERSQKGRQVGGRDRGGDENRKKEQLHMASRGQSTPRARLEGGASKLGL